MTHNTCKLDLTQIAAYLKEWAQELGFQQLGICQPDLTMHELYLKRWLEKSFQGSMHYMARHGNKRSRPELLVPGTLRVISVRMDYYPYDTKPADHLSQKLSASQQANIAVYALGKDYHSIMRKKLSALGNRLQQHIGPFGYRAFSDSAPVLERAIANQAGLGWIGKNTLLINKQEGSLFFLGELYTDLPLPVDPPASAHCGSCRRCMDVCPTQAIVGPYQLDARRCISYLTIENKGIIPKEFRPLIGNRIFGCDDCQLVCPWNKFAKKATEPKFQVLGPLNSHSLYQLFRLSESEFLRLTEGTVLRRPGYQGWLRNIAVALGNSNPDDQTRFQLLHDRKQLSDFVNQHLDWLTS